MNSTYFRAGATALIFFAGLLIAAPATSQTLTISQNDQTLDLQVADLRANTAYSGRIVDPFGSGTVNVKGYELASFWQEHFDELPDTLVFRAYDGYVLALEDWQGEGWLLITHINDTPLTLRSQGPLRLMQKTLGNRDPAVMRDFPDWVWMIRSIEAQP